MGTARTQHGGTGGKFGSVRSFHGYVCFAHDTVQYILYIGGVIFTRRMYIPCELSVYAGIKMIFSAEIGELSFNDRVKLLYAEYLITAFQELHRKLLGEGKGCCHIQERRLFFHPAQHFPYIGRTYAVGCNTDLQIALFKTVSLILRKYGCELMVTLFYLDMVLVG